MKNVYLIINGKDARKTWGAVPTGNTLSALLGPCAMKERPVFNSRTEHGSRIDNSAPKVAQRELNLEIQMTARSPEEFYSRHAAFCEELEKGAFDLSTTDRPNVVYHLLYDSCPQYTQFCRGIATLALKCTEPNPKDREAHV
ncbi:MAG: hypothetical protein K2M69_00550 [Muribaculaceae bacterium]|nr:hypothetical protein [Muribaculaceae bacterium]